MSDIILFAIKRAYFVRLLVGLQDANRKAIKSEFELILLCTPNYMVHATHDIFNRSIYLTNSQSKSISS